MYMWVCLCRKTVSQSWIVSSSGSHTHTHTQCCGTWLLLSGRVCAPFEVPSMAGDASQALGIYHASSKPEGQTVCWPTAAATFALGQDIGSCSSCLAMHCQRVGFDQLVTIRLLCAVFYFWAINELCDIYSKLLPNAQHPVGECLAFYCHCNIPFPFLSISLSLSFLGLPLFLSLRSILLVTLSHSVA